MTDRDENDDPDSTGDESGFQFRWRGLLRDLLFVVAWIVVVTFAFDILRWPSWAYYVTVFGGIFLYSLFGDPWVEPSRS